MPTGSRVSIRRSSIRLKKSIIVKSALLMAAASRTRSDALSITSSTSSSTPSAPSASPTRSKFDFSCSISITIFNLFLFISFLSVLLDQNLRLSCEQRTELVPAGSSGTGSEAAIRLMRAGVLSGKRVERAASNRSGCLRTTVPLGASCSHPFRRLERRQRGGQSVHSGETRSQLHRLLHVTVRHGDYMERTSDSSPARLNAHHITSDSEGWMARCCIRSWRSNEKEGQ